MKFNITVIGLNHKTASLGSRESVAFSSSRAKSFLRLLKILYPSHEFVILSTCNRVEIYINGKQEDIKLDKFISFMTAYHNVAQENITPFIYCYSDVKAVAHLFEVAAGIDSLVVGETEILGQIKKAYQMAFDLGMTGKALNVVFQKAFMVGKKVRTATKIGEGNVSVSSISCQLADEVLGGLLGRNILLVGSGKAGTLALKSLLDRGADTVIVSSRSYEKAEILAKEFYSKAVRFDEVKKSMLDADIVITSTSAHHFILHLEDIKRIMSERDHRPIFLIDLAVPRDIDPSIGDIKGVHLYNVDSLKNIAGKNIKKREREITQCKEIIIKEIQIFIKQNNLSLTWEKNDKLFETIVSGCGGPVSSSLYEDEFSCCRLESGTKL